FRMIHLGGDEALKIHWRRCPLCRKKIREKGLKDEDDLQRHLILELGEYLKEKGREVIVWNDVLNGGLLPSHFIIQQWMDGEEQTKKFMECGGRIIYSDISTYYFDYPYGHSDIRKIFDAKRIPPFAKGHEDNFLGLECPLWSERITNVRRASYLLFPRLTAVCLISEGKDLPDDEFTEEIKARQRLNGFNALLAVSSINAAKIYYESFKNIMRDEPGKNLKIAVIFSYAANEDEPDENPEDTSGLDQTSREFLELAIQDYNNLFGTSYDTSSEKFQNYYKDVSLRMKNKELDLLIVVNMFLTGFDAVTLNTLWADKNLKMHGLIQAFSRTNRILNSVKTFGNIICFRPLSRQVDEALALFGDNNAGGVVLIRSFKDYYYGYKDEKNGHYVPGYKDLIDKLINNFPVEQPSITGEQAQRDFINLFGAVLKMRNLLNAFDEFKDLEIISERDFQDYLSKYQDLYDEWRRKFKTGESANIIDDIIFETELIKQIEINIDYILILVSQYHASHCQDKEILIKIRKAVEASPSLRSKRNLINEFILNLNNNIADPIQAWNDYADLKREEELNNIIQDENLKRDETRKFLEKSFNNGEVNIYGSDINEFMPPVSLFDSKRADKKQRIIDKIKLFFEKFFGIGSEFKA
ncbi:MAG: family 20 glycosylhydrolase, partial [Synergistaceae bacterium]|nr:family 20 glycosylhydrolase [Synergistaceae bacterium]